jgi:DNA-binding transcriptional ArsR family regulator
MSVAAINWALRQRTGSPARKAILFTLANYANVEGVSFPSRARLAEECDMSKDAVDDNLKDLIAAGFVTKVTGRRQGRYQGTNEYQLNLDLEALENHLSRNRLVPATERQEAALSEDGPQGGSEPPTERLEPPPQGGPQGGSGAAQTLEPIEPRGTSARGRARDPQDDLFEKWWEAYPQHGHGFSKDRARVAWLALSREDRALAVEQVQRITGKHMRRGKPQEPWFWLQDRTFATMAEEKPAKPAETPGYFVEPHTPQWDAWARAKGYQPYDVLDEQRRMHPGWRAPYDTKMHRPGRWVTSEWPPERPAAGARPDVGRNATSREVDQLFALE